MYLQIVVLYNDALLEISYDSFLFSIRDQSFFFPSFEQYCNEMMHKMNDLKTGTSPIIYG